MQIFLQISGMSHPTTEFSYNNEILNWNEGKHTITSYDVTDKFATIMFDIYKFKIIFPTTVSKYFIVDCSGFSLDWMDDLNILSIEKKLTFVKILTILDKQVKKEIQKRNENKVDTVMYALTEQRSFDIDKYDFEFHKKKKEVESYISTSFSPLVASGKTAQLFNRTTVASIVVEEFMTVWKSLNTRKDITVSLVNNNIYHWCFVLNNFKNVQLNNDLHQVKNKYGYNGITIEFVFHDTLYPNYPPQVRVIRPHLSNSLMHKLANTNMLKLDYWTPTRTNLQIINRLSELIDKNAVIYVDTDMNDVKKYPDGAYLTLEAHLLKLASSVNLVDTEDIDDKKYELTNGAKTQIIEKAKQRTGSAWVAGTGYGHSGSASWDVDKYLRSQEERDAQVKGLLSKIIIDIQDAKEGPEVIYKTIQHSLLIQYVISMLDGVTLLEMSKHQSVYKLIFDLLSNIANEHGIFLFDTKLKNTGSTLYDLIDSLNTTAMYAIKLNKTDTEKDEFATAIVGLHSMMKDCYDDYSKRMAQFERKKNTMPSSTTIEKPEHKLYKEKLELMKFDMVKISGTNFKYQTELDANRHVKTTYDKRLVQEFTALQQSLPVCYDASVFVRTDENSISAIRALMTGPKDTPYENGCFIFDTYITTAFPNEPPKTWYMNTGGVRFNPNLYDSGKVCLSLLGTWGGDRGGESWNPKSSSLFQLYMSIQSQILVEQPWFNEPGYERSFGTASGKQSSDAYNNSIRYYTMCYAIRDLIKNPETYPQFTNVIKTHFFYKKADVMKTCAKWTDEASVTSSPSKAQYKAVHDEIATLLDKLKV